MLLVGIDASFRGLCLCGQTAPDWNQGHIFRSGDYKQPIAVESKTYTVSLMMMYDGDGDEQQVVFGIEGALGTGSRTNTPITLENGVPYLFEADYTADGTWGGCVNIFISFEKVNVSSEGTPMQFYMDAVQIGYDD